MKAGPALAGSSSLAISEQISGIDKAPVRARAGGMSWTRFVPFAEGASALLGGKLRQKCGGGHENIHVPAPAMPISSVSAGFAVIQAEVVPGWGPGQALHAQKAFLDGPAQTASAGELGQIGARGGIGNVIRQGLPFAAMAPQQQSAFKAGFHLPAKGNPRPLVQPRSFAAFAGAQGMPRIIVQLLSQRPMQAAPPPLRGKVRVVRAGVISALGGNDSPR